jgi:hypothetical protein
MASKTITILSAAALLAGLAPLHAAPEIGTAGAVNPASTGEPPGRAPRVLELGARVIHKERIRTSAVGSVQVVFVDKTTINIGPNSDLVIDEFVYDPARGTGSMAATLSKGVLRFVGGNTSHTGGATFKTPAVTLGIRGGVATIRHDPATGTRAINHFGTLTAITQAATEIVRRPGFVVAAASMGAPPTPPVRVTQAEVDGANKQLTSSGGQSGGSKRKPTEQAAVRAGVGAANAMVTISNAEGQRQTVTAFRGSGTQAVEAAAASNSLQALKQDAGAQQAVRVEIAQIPVDPVPEPTPSEGLFFNGWAGGLARTRAGTAPIGDTEPLIGATAVYVEPQSGRLLQVIATNTGGPGTPDGVFVDGQLLFGSYDPAAPANATYTDDRTFSATGSVSPEGAQLSTVNGTSIGASSTLSVRTASDADKAPFGGVAFCQCNYTRWGFWSATVQRFGVTGTAYTDDLRGTWVAGPTTPELEIPTSGTATYQGHVIASIRNGASVDTVAAGNLTNSFNFATRTGAVSVNNLDGRTYTGAVSLVPTTSYFAGSLTATDAEMSMIGNFVASPTDPVKEMAGQVGIHSLNGSPYAGSGIFAASR